MSENSYIQYHVRKENVIGIPLFQNYVKKIKKFVTA